MRNFDIPPSIQDKECDIPMNEIKVVRLMTIGVHQMTIVVGLTLICSPRIGSIRPDRGGFVRVPVEVVLHLMIIVNIQDCYQNNPYNQGS